MSVMAYTSLSPSKTTTGDLVLRICGTQRDGQIIRLRSAKCVVGSGPGCDLRLRSRQVAPQHCLILRGAGGTIVRSWSHDTRLNGAAFDDARLDAGDRLAIGPIEFEVIEANAAAPVAEEAVLQSALSHDLPAGEGLLASSQQDSELRRDVGRLERRVAQLASLSQGRRSRARRLIEALRRSRQQADRLEAEENRLKVEAEDASARHVRQQASLQQALDGALKERGAELAVLRKEMAEKEKTWAGQAARFETRVAELEAALSQADSPQLDAALKEKQAETETLRGELEKRQAELAAREVELERRAASVKERCESLEDRATGLQTQAAECAAQRSALQAAEQELGTRESQLAQREEAVQARLSAVEAKLAELEEARTEIERAERASLKARDLETELATRETAIEELQAQLQADRDDLEMQRRQWQQQREQEPVSQPRKSQQSEAVPARSQEAAVTTRASAPASEEDSIQQYMAQLLERVRGGSQQEATWTEPERDEPQSRYAPAPPQAEPEYARQAIEEPHEDAPVEMAPRAAAPENQAGLAAMRSLANLSAKHALKTHARSVLTKSVRVRLLLTVLALATSGFLFKMWSHFHTGDVTFYGAICSLIVAAVWGGHFVVLTVRLAMHRHVQTEEPLAEESAEAVAGG